MRQARVALHGGDVPAVRQLLVRAQRLRPLLTYAIPHLATQARHDIVSTGHGTMVLPRPLVRQDQQS